MGKTDTAAIVSWHSQTIGADKAERNAGTRGPHNMMDSSQIKEIHLDSEEKINISSKIKNMLYFSFAIVVVKPLEGFAVTMLRCSPCTASLSRVQFSQRGPHRVHPQTVCQQLWHDADQKRNALDLSLLVVLVTRCRALKPFNFSNTACRRIRLSRRHLTSVFGSLYGNVRHLESSFVDCLRPSSASAADGCSAKSSGTSVLGAQTANRNDREQNSGHFHHLQRVGGWEEKKGSAPGSFGTY